MISLPISCPAKFRCCCFFLIIGRTDLLVDRVYSNHKIVYLVIVLIPRANRNNGRFVSIYTTTKYL